MRLKTVLLTVIAVCFLSSAALAEGPDLTGTWAGSVVGYFKGQGFLKDDDPNNGKWVVTEVKDGAFVGKKYWKEKGKEFEEDFSGVMSLDGKRFYVAEHNAGLLVGDVLSPDHIVFYYTEDGDAAKVIRFDYKRVK